MNVVMHRFNGSSWVPMYPRTTINQVIGLNEELTNLQNQIDNLSPSGGGWTLLYSGSTTLSLSSFTSIDLSDSVSVGDVLAIEVRHGSSSTSLNSKIILTAIGDSSSTSTSSTQSHRVGFTDFDGEYFKNIYFSVYRSLPTRLRVGYYSYLWGRFLPASKTIEWDANYATTVLVTRVWKVI